MSKVTIEIEKWSDNGYKGTMTYGETTRTYGCTSLPEAVGWAAYHSGAVFQESPFMPLQREPYAQTQQTSVPETRAQPPPIDHSDPELVDKIAERFSAYGSNGNGRVSVVAFVVCALAALGMATGGWVA